MGANFPDPSAAPFYKRFFVGFGYPIEAIRLCLTSEYAMVAFFDTIVVTLVMLVSCALGISLGIYVRQRIWMNPVNETSVLVGIIWYNFHVLSILLTITLSVILTSIFFLFGLFIASFFINQNVIRLSHLVEKEMYIANNLEYHDVGEKFETTSLVNDYLTSVWVRYIKSGFSILKKLFQRYLIKGGQFILTNTVTAFITVPVPGVGAVVYIIVFICLTTIEIPTFGFDVIFERRRYTFYEQQKTIWNNLALIIGCGAGCIVMVCIFPPFIILLYPVVVISTTRMFVHLESHGKTKDQSLRLLC